jgi:hypothetical protein
MIFAVVALLGDKLWISLAGACSDRRQSPCTLGNSQTLASGGGKQLKSIFAFIHSLKSWVRLVINTA